MKKTIIRLTSFALILAAVFSMSACGSGIRVRAVAVKNDTFFEESYREYLLNDSTIPEDGKYYKLAAAIGGTAEEFMQNFLWKYDSNTGMALVLEVRNKSKEAVTVTGLQTENNGNKDTYVSACIGYGEEVEIPAGETKQVRVCFIGNGGYYTNEEFITRIFCDMPMQLNFKNASGEQWAEKVKLKPVKAEQ